MYKYAKNILIRKMIWKCKNRAEDARVLYGEELEDIPLVIFTFTDGLCKSVANIIIEKANKYTASR